MQSDQKFRYGLHLEISWYEIRQTMHFSVVEVLGGIQDDEKLDDFR